MWYIVKCQRVSELRTRHFCFAEILLEWSGWRHRMPTCVLNLRITTCHVAASGTSCFVSANIKRGKIAAKLRSPRNTLFNPVGVIIGREQRRPKRNLVYDCCVAQRIRMRVERPFLKPRSPFPTTVASCVVKARIHEILDAYFQRQKISRDKK